MQKVLGTVLMHKKLGQPREYAVWVLVQHAAFQKIAQCEYCQKTGHKRIFGWKMITVKISDIYISSVTDQLIPVDF